MRTIDLLVIGLTSHHSEHINALKTFSQVKVVGICNTKYEDASLLSQQFKSVPIFSDFKDAIDVVKPSAVFICLPHNQYFNIIEHLFKKNIHIFKEKPFAYNLDEAIKLLKLSTLSRGKLMVVSQRRFHPTYENVNRYLEEIGQIKNIICDYSFNKTTVGWRRKMKDSGGGVVIDSGYHFIDLITHLLGLPVDVSCKTKKISSDELCETEDFAEIYLSYPKNVKVKITLNRLSDNKNEEIIISGTRGELIVNRSVINIKYFNNLKVKNITETDEDFTNSYKKQHKLFYESIENDLALKPSIKEGVMNSIVIESCYKSAAKSQNIINITNFISSKGLYL